MRGWIAKEQKEQSMICGVFLMKLEQGQESILADIVNTFSRFEEVIGIILFGSRARGDHDEFSD
jgi:predicted nucleotidyltransferase